MKNSVELNMDDVRHQIALRGIDECKLLDIVAAAKQRGIVNAPVGKEALNVAEVLLQLERIKMGGMAQTVDAAHQSLTERGLILVPHCPQPKHASQPRQNLL